MIMNSSDSIILYSQENNGNSNGGNSFVNFIYLFNQKSFHIVGFLRDNFIKLFVLVLFSLPPVEAYILKLVYPNLIGS